MTDIGAKIAQEAAIAVDCTLKAMALAHQVGVDATLNGLMPDKYTELSNNLIRIRLCLLGIQDVVRETTGEGTQHVHRTTVT
jgi:hypothetical protein